MKRRELLAKLLGGVAGAASAGWSHDGNPGDRRLRWTHLSSRKGDLPAPGKALQQTACQILDVDKDGLNDFLVAARAGTPALVWYRRTAKGWTKYLIDEGPLPMEAGGALGDIDGDGDLDIVMGGDSGSNEVWWWENPYPDYDPGTPWRRCLIKMSGATQHHDQLIGDFNGDGKPELVFWNQGANALLMAPIPRDPKNTGLWPCTEIYTSASKSEGLAAADMDKDGKIEIVGGGCWFKHQGGTKFIPHIIDDTMRNSRVVVGQLIEKTNSPQVVFVVGDGVGRLKWYEQTGSPNSEEWTGHDLLGFDVVHGHSLQIADIDGDGNLDIFCAEMGKWTETASQPDNPNAKMWIFFGDGKRNFMKTELAAGVGNHESKVGDLDGDGRLDILVKPYNWDTPRVDIWLNRGSA